jgi:hypothetical protein
MLWGSAAARKEGANIIAPGDQADYQQDDKPDDSQPASAEAAARLASPILNIAA